MLTLEVSTDETVVMLRGFEMGGQILCLQSSMSNAFFL